MGYVVNRGSKHRPNWYIRWKEHGRWKWRPSHQPTKEQARRYVEAIEARIARGKVGIEEPTPDELTRRSITLAEVVKKFLADYSSPRIKDMTHYRREVGYLLNGHLVPTLGSKRAAEVTRNDVSHLRDQKLAAGLSKATVKAVLAYTSRLYNWARIEGIIDAPNPVAAVEKPSLAGQELDYRYLSADEVDNLLAWTRENQPTEYPLYATAVYTGLRMGELFGLRWNDVHLDQRDAEERPAPRLIVRRSYRLAPKSGKPRTVPINPRLLPVLRRWKEQAPPSGEGLVFPEANGSMRSKDKDYGFKAAMAGAGCHDVGFHGLRHTFASHFMMAGGNILTLQKILGHSSVNVTMKYAHLAPDYMREEIGRLAFERTAAGVVDIGSHTPAALGGTR